ncbi:hypothetical protein L6452_18228 [Arctium lappa]|uniref:Uncharacterized protein n=1 Tax=Arctium lappa TaxID=4217 RepID=A0ACB9C5V8_ARCLA|nr:hypothetical protein L6452_18228 [Arctium lappa]
MASFSPSPNSPPVSDPPLQPSPPAAPTSTPPIPSNQSSPPSTTAPPPSTDLPSNPPSSPPPASLPPPSRPPSSPPVSSSSPPNSPPPPSSIPPSNSPPPPSSIPPSNSPPPPSSTPSSIPPPKSPPPPSSIPPSNSPPPASPAPPTRSPPPTSPPPSNPPPPPSSPPLPSLSPPSRSPPPSRSVPPQPPQGNSPPPTSPPAPSILRPPPPSTNSSSPPRLTPPPPKSPSTNSSAPPVIVASPPPFTLSPPDVLIPPPGNTNNNDSSPNPPSNNGGIGTGAVVGIAAVLGVVLLTVIIGVLWCLIKRKKKFARNNELYIMPTSMGSSPASDSGLLKIQTSAVQNGNLSANDFVYTQQDPGGLGNSRPQFSYEELAKATNGFSAQNLLGSGGFGSVYKGCLADGTEVAVKELKIGGGQGEREFSAEVEIISRIHHRYLVSLVGYCISENKRLLVYEYVPNNTLYFHLHGSELVLDWPTRVKVASGAARGIAYLHEDCHPRVIHRDIKSSNILLDKNFEARVADFGLAKLAADLNTHITTRVMGTFGYMAPEYASSGKLTEKSDVFSFGVVLLELITGRKPVDASQPLGDESLVEWARPLLSHAIETEDFEGLVDQRLGTNYVAKEMFRMIEAAAACVRHSSNKRPRMGQIVRAFESMETDDLSNGMRVGESEVFNSAQQSAEIRLFRRMAFGSQDYSTDFFTQGSYGHNSNERSVYGLVF